MPKKMPPLAHGSDETTRPVAMTGSDLRANALRGWLCSPLQSWRPDDPTLLPFCQNPPCGRPIAIGARYFVADGSTNAAPRVYCAPCARTLAETSNRAIPLAVAAALTVVEVTRR